MSLTSNLPRPPARALPKPPPAGQPSQAAQNAPPPPVLKLVTPVLPPSPAGLGPAGLGPAGQAIAVSAPAADPLPGVSLDGLPPSLAPMIEAIRLYDAILIEENRLLRTHKGPDVSVLQERKVAATRLYNERLRAVLSDEKIRTALTPEQRSGIRAIVRALDERATENAMLLKAHIHAIERLFGVINEAVRKQRQKDVTYSKRGIMSTQVTNGAAIAFNKTI